jgi:predicted branched-subunit amino acid permease
VTAAGQDGTGRSRAIVREGIAVGVATGAYGLSFGAIGVASGLDVWQTAALSLLMFTGASQFALVGVVASGGSPWSGAATAVLLGTRNGLYGLRLAPLLGWTGWQRSVAAHLVIDESTAMAINRDGRKDARTGFLSAGLAVFLLWNLATVVGAVAGATLGDPRDLGLDAAVGAAFLALLWPRLRTRTNQVVACLAVAVALGMVPVSSAGAPVLAAAVVALVAGVVGRSADPTEVPDRDDLPGGGVRR